MIRLFPRDAMGDRKRNLVGDFLGVFFVIDAGGDDATAGGLDLGEMLCVVGQLPTAIGSPMAPIKEHHVKLSF